MDYAIRIVEIAEAMHRAEKITVFTGAGLSALSGIPTYRDSGGLWKTHDPNTLSTKAAFKKDPRKVWDFAQTRRRLIKNSKPNISHQILADWSHRYPHMTLITQNIDDLHHRVGTHNVLRLHGSVWNVACSLPCEDSPRRWRDERVEFSKWPPRCHYCGALLRPGGIWFGERLPLSSAFQSLKATQCDVFLSIGTSAEVHPAAKLIGEAKSAGALIVEINPNITPASALVSHQLQAKAEHVLAEIEAQLQSQHKLE